MVKNYILSIQQELQELYTKSHEHLLDRTQLAAALPEFVESTVALLDYYVQPIYKSVMKNTNTKTARVLRAENETFIQEVKLTHLAKFGERLQHALHGYLSAHTAEADRLYHEILELVVLEVLRIYKLTQLNVMKQAGLDDVLFLTHEDDCLLCKLRHGSLVSIKKLEAELYSDNRHLLCASSFQPNVDVKTKDYRIGKLQLHNLPVVWEHTLIRPLQRIALTMMTKLPNITIEFVHDFQEVPTWQKLGIDGHGHNINALREGNTLYINNQAKDMLELIIRHLAQDVTAEVQLGWWNDRFKAKQQKGKICGGSIIYGREFISRVAQTSVENYLYESTVAYLLRPTRLKELDPEAYDRLTEEVFHD